MAALRGTTAETTGEGGGLPETASADVRGTQVREREGQNGKERQCPLKMLIHCGSK